MERPSADTAKPANNTSPQHQQANTGAHFNSAGRMALLSLV
jgi:hypothetical protein